MQDIEVKEGERVLVNRVVCEYCGGSFCEVPRYFRCGATDCDCPPATRDELRDAILGMGNSDVFRGGDIAYKYNTNYVDIMSVPDELLADGRIELAREREHQ